VTRHALVLGRQAGSFADPRRWAEHAGLATVAVLERIGRAVENFSWQAARGCVRAIKWRRVALVASAPFTLPREFRGAMVRILAYLGAITALSLIGAAYFTDRQTTDAAEAPPRSAWLEVDKPWPAFELSIPGFSEDDARYMIRRNVAGGGRKDILTFGELGRTQRFMSFEVYRVGDEVEDFGRTVDDVRALAAEHGRISTMQTAMPLPSKFGNLQAFEFGIGPFNSYKCIGFVRNSDTPRVQIGGLSCNMNLLVDRSAISCALDRLTLMSAGSAPELARLFAQAELKRSFCGQRDHLLYATPKRPGAETTHIADAKPRLRGRIAR
jgi:hypothetical protein